MPTTTLYNVSVFVPGAIRALESVDFDSKEAAERHAEMRKAMVSTQHWNLQVVMKATTKPTQ